MATKTKSKGPGRPRKPKAERRTETPKLPLSPAEHETLRQAADAAGLPLTVWARDRLLRTARAELGA